jgi:hypothetical protein
MYDKLRYDDSILSVASEGYDKAPAKNRDFRDKCSKPVGRQTSRVQSQSFKVRRIATGLISLTRVDRQLLGSRSIFGPPNGQALVCKLDVLYQSLKVER